MKKNINFLIFSLAISFLFVACANEKSQNENRPVEYTTNEVDYTSIDMMGANEGEAPAESKDGSTFYFNETGAANTETYSKIVENEFKKVKDTPLSTFGIDVDKASYSNARRFLNSGQLPPKDAVRVEEFINYFHYDYPNPSGEHPFSITTEVAECPWNTENKLVHIGLKSKAVSFENTPPSNLVFLLDVSGSMGSQDKLPLLKEAFKLLVSNLRPEDRVAIVTYAGSEGLVLPSTPGNEKMTILESLNRLESGGSTAGGAGINLAYKTAMENRIKGGNNRIILATDGDFNVGITKDEALVKLIEKRRKQGVFLSVLGFGTGNYQDAKMEKIADNGNGNYAYIDNLNEAKKVLVTEMSGTLLTIAKDVKLQIEFDKKYVKSYRLVGYENRMLKDEEFDDDKKDAGDMGAGHSVTALYEVVPNRKSKDDEIMNIKFRYKRPNSNTSKLFEQAVVDANTNINETSNNYRFSAAVASFGMLLRDSKFKGTANYDQVKSWAINAQGADLNGYRAEFISLIDAAKLLEEMRNTAEH